MMLVEYRCPDCGGRAEHWVRRPVPGRTACARCPGTAIRRFGGALLTGAAPDGRPPPPHAGAADERSTRPHAGGGCAADVPGTCTLVPTAARMLAAKARGDRRAEDRERAHQESAIASGALDPSGPLTTAFAGGPAAPARGPTA